MASSRCAAHCNFANTPVRTILSFGKVSKYVLHTSAFVAANSMRRGTGLGFCGDCDPTDWTVHETILKDAKLADLPIVRPTKFELVNLKAEGPRHHCATRAARRCMSETG
jgi:hypothetical protein